MLNVAVSRAKDSFLVFGDMDIFDPAHLSRYSSLLARYLFAEETNALDSYQLPFRVGDGPNNVNIHLLSTLAQQRSSLARAFERAQKRLVIVSPYLRIQAVKADDVAVRVQDAVRRGVKVTVYVDDHLNKHLLNDDSAAKAATDLCAAGAAIKVCRNIHSKAICIDEDIFIEGTFHWLSADRGDHYRRREHSIIYTGAHASEFIKETIDDLERVVIATKTC